MDFHLSNFVASTRIVEDASLVDTIEDWSGVRSPGRASRRRKLGHRQNITLKSVPRQEVYFLDGGRTMVVHPEVARAIEQQIAQRMGGMVATVVGS
jgi:hypothetical protein